MYCHRADEWLSGVDGSVHGQVFNIVFEVDLPIPERTITHGLSLRRRMANQEP